GPKTCRIRVAIRNDSGRPVAGGMPQPAIGPQPLVQWIDGAQTYVAVCARTIIQRIAGGERASASKSACASARIGRDNIRLRAVIHVSGRQIEHAGGTKR